MKYLAIDIGQVICHLDFNNFNKKLSKYAGITEEESYEFLVNSQKSHDLGYSILEKDLSNKFYGLHLPIDQVKDIVDEWYKTVKPNLIVMSWLQKLLNSNKFKIALVSNIGTEHAEHMKSILSEIYSHKNIIRFFSCEAGCRKPTYLYYNLFLSMYPKFKNCVYMDDNEHNIKNGKLFGFDSVLFNLETMSDLEIENKLVEIERKL